ncbi:MAG TPA: hypothetical protein PKK20_11895 [Verrucomicrobiota bacterium]|nr:hypothetical protein [Verrucomicrobiota bacterium]HNV00631.1 hypothetical protein [Verrucomicrobiota bacterium]HOF48172.1 hypothetical protein [Verrucomicrobiota bacterium]HOG86548.1 hypothetical protein [Verrucomicrobiota bacterium]HOR71321.1 hypothetical protein [Verrucomicrobiota bacterium]
MNHRAAERAEGGLFSAKPKRPILDVQQDGVIDHALFLDTTPNLEA